MKKQIRIILLVLALFTSVSLAMVLFRKDAKAPSSNGASSGPSNIGNSDNITEEEKEYYMNAPGSSRENPAAMDIGYPIFINGYECYVDYLPVDVDVLYYNKAFYGEDCKVYMKYSGSVIPFNISIENEYLYEVKIYFSDPSYLQLIRSENAVRYDYDYNECYVIVMYYGNEYSREFKEDAITYGVDGRIPKEAIRRMEIYTV